jgi:short-subunit dehydrogenase
MDLSKCHELFDVNFFGMLHCMQAVIPAMKEARGGTIINISSVAGHVPVPYMAAYSASKFAMNAIGKAARLELDRDNVHVLTVCPGYVRTEFGANMIASKVGNVRPKSVRGITAERVAVATYEGYRKQKREVIVPWIMHPVVKMYQLFPSLVEWGMKRGMRNA